jgi:putative FmdB family regulatory protein
MPIYEYKCKKGHVFEVMQRMADDSLEQCATCGAPVQRVFHPIAVHFKGSGFYNTDYGKQKGKGTQSESGASDSGSSTDSGSSSDKGSSEKGSSDKGSSDKGSSEKGSSADKGDKKASKASASSDS